MYCLGSKILRNFTVQSQRNRVPKLLKDPRFTKQGMLQKKSKSYKYDLTQPHIVNPHLYYDESVDKKQERLQMLEKKRLNRSLPSPNSYQRSLQEILDETMRRDILDKPSKRILVNLIELKMRFPEQEETYKDIAIFATKRICSKPIIFSLRELGIASDFANKYIPYEKEVWEKLRDTIYGKINAFNYREESFFGNDQEDNICNSIVYIVSRSSNLKLKTEFLVNSLIENISSYKFEPKSFKNIIKVVSSILKDGSIKENEEDLAKINSIINERISEINYLDAIELLSSISKGKISFESLITSLSKIVVNKFKTNPKLTIADLKAFSKFSQTAANLRNFISAEEKDLISNIYNANSKDFDIKSKIFMLQSLHLLRSLTENQREQLNQSLEDNFNKIPKNCLSIILASSGKNLEGLTDSLQVLIAKGLANSLEKFNDSNMLTKKKISILKEKFADQLSQKEKSVLMAISKN